MSHHTPHWDIDRDYGEAGERYLADVLGWLAVQDHLRVEVKRKRRADDWLYLELMHRPASTGQWARSGLNTTQAELFAFVVADTGVALVIPTGVLRALVASETPVYGRPAEERDGDCPTEGRLVRVATILRFASEWRKP